MNQSSRLITSWCVYGLLVFVGASSILLVGIRTSRSARSRDSGVDGGEVSFLHSELENERLSPFLKLDNQHYDFGNVSPGENLKGQFRLTNEGAAPLLISTIKTSCGCAPAKIGVSNISPGDCTTLDVSFRVPSHAGSFAHFVEFSTNDPARTHVRLTFSARAQWPVEVDPPALRFSGRQSEFPAMKEIQLYSPDLSSFNVVAFDATIPCVSVTEVAGNVGHRRTFRVNVERNAQANSFSGYIRFSTSCSKRPLVIVPITGEILPEQLVVPQRVLLDPSPPSGTKAIRLTVASTSNVCINSLTVTDPTWEITEWNSHGNDAMRIVALHVRVPSESGYHRSALLMSMNDGHNPIEIPISCLVTTDDLSSTDEDAEFVRQQKKESEVVP